MNDIEVTEISIENPIDVKVSYLGDIFVLRDGDNSQCIKFISKSGETSEKCSSEISNMENLELYGRYGGMLFVNNNHSVFYSFNRGCKWSKMIELDTGIIISSASNRVNNHMGLGSEKIYY